MISESALEKTVTSGDGGENYSKQRWTEISGQPLNLTEQGNMRKKAGGIHPHAFRHSILTTYLQYHDITTLSRAMI